MKGIIYVCLLDMPFEHNVQLIILQKLLVPLIQIENRLPLLVLLILLLLLLLMINYIIKENEQDSALLGR